MKRIGILITHGTDTMAWAFHFLRYSLKNLACNIAITGSQVPLQLILGASDAPLNLRNSLMILSYATPPNILMVFNNGKYAFDDDIRKIHMWDNIAFDGQKILEFGSDHIRHVLGDFEIDRPRKLDILLTIRTGGTIESSKVEEGYFVPGSPKELTLFLSQFENIIFDHLVMESISNPKDSSNMTPKDWFELVDIIVNYLRNYGFKTYADKAFNFRVGIIFVNPMMTYQDYVSFMKNYDGIIIAGYGGGNGNIEEGDYSLIRAVKWARKNNKYVILASQIDRGIEEPIYETGWKIIEAGALPSGSFGIPKSQIKLAYILGHMDIIKKVADEYKIDKDQLVALAFLSGIKFRTEMIKRRIEKLIGLRIPDKDYFFNIDFEEALRKMLERSRIVETKMLKICSSDDLMNLLDKIPVGELKNYVAIIKPDTIVGENLWGEPLDASESLRNILKRSFGWESIIFELHNIDPESLPLEKGSGEFFRNAFKIIYVEGGRPSIYDPSSFRGKLTQKEFIRIIKSIALNRKSLSAPAIYICLGHQALVEALRLTFIDIVDSAKDIINDLKTIDEKMAKEFMDLIKKLDNKGKTIKIKDDLGNIVAEGYRHSLFAVKKNEMREIEVKRLVPYRPNKDIDKDLLEAYTYVSRIGSGIIEDLVTIDDISVTLIHSDEVNEEAVLFLNYAFHSIHRFLLKHKNKTEKISKKPKASIITKIPFGLEILCSTKYERNDKLLTQVGGLAIYYYDYDEDLILRDFSLQFHPEILQDLRVAQSVISKKIAVEDDGIKLLITLAYSSFAKNSINLQ